MSDTNPNAVRTGRRMALGGYPFSLKGNIMPAMSIAETGALPGDTVVCVSLLDEQSVRHRYTVKKKYTAVDFCGSVCIFGNEGYTPLKGFGAEWAKSDEA